MSFSINLLKARVDTSEFPANLTARERQIIETMAEVGTRKIAADKLCISIPTLSDHLKACNIKAGAHCSVVLVARYLKATLKNPQEPPCAT